ncbi:hypothetical protein PGT21_019826 [Puccinia graminis f. sp. tritici]|uniref:Uncharacterized protein n=2 Tax=Puccinia graminis f. sp. tritici TaxID=56615 RepID=H6QVC4_PUCGT|nr:uncharacterized protein PGTG_22645 [Puccinia graminis f. sp. tritici CRL 75-36-700-3]EHS62853.1 hypothetical protein PGTG_22645 [Puccinia graminis f. sp. tritici CRL 75-36-700-3]KAA1087021.1 hypothetical protein PGT21_019826 [Puccinia graminis f. sp. tritici]
MDLAYNRVRENQATTPIHQSDSVATSQVFSQDSGTTYSRPSNQPSNNSLDEGLLLPGEPIVCKTKSSSNEYWPARLIGREGSLSKQTITRHNEQLYRVHFCDEEQMLLPRSFFLTVFQEEFFTAKLGQLETIEATFDQLFPKLLEAIPKIDSIVAGAYMEESVTNKHEAHLTGTTEAHGSAGYISYGQYSEAIICSMTQYLTNRYIHEQPPQLIIDQRFFKLTEQQQTTYVLDVIVPEAMILITQADFSDKVLDSHDSRALAIDYLNEQDIVSLINVLRTRIKA